YTCFNVSRNFLIFGATSGGLYVFRREPCIFLQLLPNKEGSVTKVSISPDEKFFAFATLKGVVCILERHHSQRIRRIQMSIEHHGSEITALQWNSFSNELFIGDDSGKVSALSVSVFTAKNMFQTPSFVLMQLDSRIVQLDWCLELLLVSTLSRCYICDTLKEQYRQIGHKLRDGEYGACFYTAGDHNDLPSRSEHRQSTMGGAFSSLNEGEKLLGYEDCQNLKMFCARPGSRFWEVHIDGTVLSTHQFKQAFAVAPTTITKTHETESSTQKIGNVSDPTQNDVWCQQSFNFTKLFIIAKKFVFTYKRDGIYVLDPDKGTVVLWNNSFKDIIDAKILNEAIYVWTATGHMHALVMLPVDKFLVRLYLRKQYTLCAQLCEQHNNYLLELAPTSSKLQLLADLGTKLDDQEVATKISPLLNEIGKYAQERQNAQRLRSGIFLVGNTQFLCSEEESRVSLLPTPSNIQRLNVDSHKEKSRSLNASPESIRRKKNGVHPHHRMSGSTTSLPELVHHVSSMDVSVENNTQSNHRCHMKEVHDSHSDGLVFETKPEFKSTKSNDSLYSLDPAFPPEAIQALKELRHSVSWKSLKEKWQVLEGKMKLLNQETCPEPLDVRPADYRDSILEEILHSSDGEQFLPEDELVHTSNEKLKHKTSQFPVLDVSSVTEICSHIAPCDRNGENNTEHIDDLINNVDRLYESFIANLIQKHCGADEDGSVQSSKMYLLNTELSIMAAFPFSYYFNDDVVKVIREGFHFALRTKRMINWLQRKTHCMEHTEQFPDQIKSTCSDETLNLDILLSKVLIIFSEVLDPKLTLQYIKEANLHCYYLSLCVILDRYQDGTLRHISMDKSATANYEELPLPLLLNTIFFMFNMERIETCCKLGKRVSTKDIWYLVLRLQQYLEATDKTKKYARSHCYSLFLSYLEKMSASKDNLSEIIADSQIRLYIIAAFEELNSVENGSCVCGFPVLVPPSLLHSEVAESLVLYYWENNGENLLEICKKVPSLWHFILRKKRNEGFSSVIPLIIHLGDTLELTHWLPSMDQGAWDHTLDLLATFRAGTCLNCRSELKLHDGQVGGILWSSVGPLLVKVLGPRKTVQLLTKYAAFIKPGELDTSNIFYVCFRFFQSCIYSAIIDNHAKGLRNEVIDMLNEYSKKATETALFSPYVSNIILFDIQISPSLEEALKEDLGRSAEFSLASEEHHWGAKVNMVDGTCPCCALPLNSSVLMKDGGVTIFRCGHSYHVVCLKRQTQPHTCPICIKNS
ncbi:hypothetical protein ANN_02654, partial [Periplaneta americana]